MIQIGNLEYIKKSSDFKMDGLHVKKFSFEFPVSANSRQSLSVELVPYGVLDDGTRVFDVDTVYKIYIPDVDQYLATHSLPNVIGAYFATEQGISDLLGEKYPNLQTTFVPPTA